jgi:hypothetical protein
MLGVIDVATEVGLEKHNEDFGQTLGRWGLGDGPYLVLPFLGPSSFRDAIGVFVDFKTDPMTYIDNVSVRNILWGTRFVSRRAELLDTSKIVDTAALDPYEFVRDAYLQRRRNLVFDGNPPPDKEYDIDIKVKPQTMFQSPPDFTRTFGAAIAQRELTPAQLEAREREAAESRAAGRRAELPAESNGPGTARLWLPVTSSR